MRNLILSIGCLALVSAFAACSSSSTSPPPATDAGPDVSVDAVADTAPPSEASSDSPVLCGQGCLAGEICCANASIPNYGECYKPADTAFCPDNPTPGAGDSGGGGGGGGDSGGGGHDSGGGD
jgi:hypothetical protein